MPAHHEPHQQHKPVSEFASPPGEPPGPEDDEAGDLPPLPRRVPGSPDELARQLGSKYEPL